MLLVSPIESPEALQAQIDLFSLLVTRFTILVAAGVALEAVEFVHDIGAWNKKRHLNKKESADLKEAAEIFPVGELVTAASIHSDNPRWVKWVVRFGLIIVVIGVSGEWWFGAKLEGAHNAMHRFDMALLKAAQQQAGDAEISAKGAAVAASEAKSSAKGAQGASDTALRQSNAVSKRADELTSNLAATGKQLESVDANRAELEKSLTNLAVCSAPRVISPWLTSSGIGAAKSYVDPLRPMAGQMVFIEVVPDEEARRAALNIAGTLADARWDVQKPIKLVDGLADGVSVQTSVPALTGNGIPNMAPSWHASDVAEKLRDFLHSYNWQATRGAPRDAQGKTIHDEKILPVGAIRIQIGLYPPTMYVNPPGRKELTSRFEEVKREQEKAEAELKRKREARWATLPPEDRQKLQQKYAEIEAKIKSETSNSPCQVLSPLF